MVDPWRQSTYCPGRGELVIGPDWHAITAYRLEGDRYGKCGHRISGSFDEARHPAQPVNPPLWLNLRDH